MIPKTKGWVGATFVESIIVDGNPRFLCREENGDITVKEKVECKGETIRPVYENEVGYIPYKFTSDEINKLSKIKLTREEILEDVKKAVEHFIVASDEARTLLLGDYLLSYCQEWISTLHYTFAVGETESGKSSILHLARWLCYRCLYGEDIPMADIYNFLGQDEEGCGTIAEDEAQDIYHDKEKINMYKNSYAKGSKKPRIIGIDSLKRRQVHYKTFCPKWFAGEKIPSNKGFNERLAVIYMSEGEPEGNIKRPTKDEVDQLNQLRNKMLMWKIQNLENEIFRHNSGLNGRNQELWEDFVSLGKDTKFQSEFTDVVKYYTIQRRKTITDSIEAKLFKLAYEMLDEKDEIKFEEYWKNLADGNSEISGKLNGLIFHPDEYSEKISKYYLAKLFDNKFQATKEIRNLRDENQRQHQETYYVFKQDIVKRLVKKYGIQDSNDPSDLGQLGQHGNSEESVQ